MYCKTGFKLTLCTSQITQKLSKTLKTKQKIGLREDALDGAMWRDGERTIAEEVGCIRPIPLSEPNRIKLEAFATTTTFNENHESIGSVNQFSVYLISISRCAKLCSLSDSKFF